MVEEGSFITADFSGELQNVDECIPSLSIALYGFRSFPSVGQVCHKVFNCNNVITSQLTSALLPSHERQDDAT